MKGPRLPRGARAASWLICLAACAPGAEETGGPRESPGASPDVTAEVQAFLDDYLDAVSRRDSERLRGMLVPDRYRWAERGAVQYRSLDGMLSSLAQFPPDLPIRTETSGLEVVPVGEDAAYALTQFTTTVGTGDSGFAFGGLMTFVLERFDGSWRIVGGHVSSPPVPAEDSR